jgi:purine-binding chemotaxis protein CheW
MRRGRQRLDVEKSLVGFIVGQVTYAVPIAQVREIANPVATVRLPHAPRSVVGVADHRGEVIPVIDLRIRFGTEATGEFRKVKWILADIAGRTVALVVDGVTEVFGTGGEELREPPELGGGEAQRGLLGVSSHAGSLVFVLDLSEFESLTRTLGLPEADGGREYNGP